MNSRRDSDMVCGVGSSGRRRREWSIAGLPESKSIAHSDPYAAGRSDGAELLGRRVEAERGSERAIRPGERVGAEDREVLVAAVQNVDDAGENLPIVRHPPPGIDIDHRVARYATVHIAVIFIAVGVLAGGEDDAPTHGPTCRELEISAQLQRVGGDPWN